MPFASASAANERLLLVVEILSRTDTRYQIPDTRYKAQDTFTYSHAANWLLCVSVRVCGQFACQWRFYNQLPVTRFVLHQAQTEG